MEDRFRHRPARETGRPHGDLRVSSLVTFAETLAAWSARTYILASPSRQVKPALAIFPDSVNFDDQRLESLREALEPHFDVKVSHYEVRSVPTFALVILEMARQIAVHVIETGSADIIWNALKSHLKIGEPERAQTTKIGLIIEPERIEFWGTPSTEKEYLATLKAAVEIATSENAGKLFTWDEGHWREEKLDD